MPQGRSEERESALQSGWTVEGRSDKQQETEPAVSAPAAAGGADADGADTVGAEAGGAGDEAASDDRAQLSNLTVVLLGLSGGIFLLYAWVWLSWAKFYADSNTIAAMGSGSIGQVLQQIVFWISPLAPVLWFLSSILLVRSKPRRLAFALVIGLIVTFPLPMIFATATAL